MVASTAPTATAPQSKPVRLTGVLAALVVLAIVMFAVPPTSRLWIAGVVVVMALLVRGGDAANLINQFRAKVYGG